MNICIFSWFGYIIPLEDRLKLISESGFNSTCLWWEDETYPNLIPVEKMPKMVKDNGLLLDNIHCPYEGVNNLWSKNTNLQNTEIEKYLHYVDCCRIHDIPYMVMHATDEGFSSSDYNIGLESFKVIAKYAYKNSVKVAVENTRDVEIIDFLLGELSYENLGLCYDSSHDWITGQSKGALLKRWNSRLFTTHLSDNDFNDDKHWIPTDGMIEWQEIMPYILNSPIQTITMELMSSKDKINDPKMFLKKAKEKLEGLMNG